MCTPSATYGLKLPAVAMNLFISENMPPGSRRGATYVMGAYLRARNRKVTA